MDLKRTYLISIYQIENFYSLIFSSILMVIRFELVELVSLPLMEIFSIVFELV